jgi:putative lipoic acid-binding regulatory protein
VDFVRFKTLLDEQHAWPCDYTFKFIVPKDRMQDVLALFPGETPVLRPSAKSTYVGVTFNVAMEHGDAVIAVYRRAVAIEGLISL